MNTTDFLIEQIPHKGYNINIYEDEDTDDPRSWDHLGTFYTAHSRWQPEKNFYDHFGIEEVCENGRPGQFRKSFLDEYIALNIYLYDHSGLTISSAPFSCAWDSCWSGIVAVSVEKVKKEYGWKRISKARRERIESYLQGEIDTYDQYLRGEVYRYEITPLGDETDVLESAGGYFGNVGIEDIKTEGRAIIETLIRDCEMRQQEERLRLYGPEIPFPEFAMNNV